MGTQKRYVATITVYVYAEDDESALKASKTICDKINHDDECPNADIEKLHIKTHGKLESKEIDISEMKSNLEMEGLYESNGESSWISEKMV